MTFSGRGDPFGSSERLGDSNANQNKTLWKDRDVFESLEALRITKRIRKWSQDLREASPELPSHYHKICFFVTPERILFRIEHP